MKRKLVKQGAATMMISLPSKWVKNNKLEKGDEVDLEEKNNELVIMPNAEGKSKSIELNITLLTESSIIAIITNAYRLGYDKIKINFADRKAVGFIESTIKNNLIGFEIIKRSEKFCEIENITEPLREQFENVFSKVFLNIEELFRILENALKGEKEGYKEIELKVQQFDNFCRRVLVKKSAKNPQLTWAFHSEMIHGQRELYMLLKYLENNKIKKGKGVLVLLEDCKKIFNMLKRAYLEKDVKILEEIHALEKLVIYKKGYAMLEKENPVVVHHILSAIRNFYLSTSPLFGIFSS